MQSANCGNTDNDDEDDDILMFRIMMMMMMITMVMMMMPGYPCCPVFFLMQSQGSQVKSYFTGCKKCNEQHMVQTKHHNIEFIKLKKTYIF